MRLKMIGLLAVFMMLSVASLTYAAGQGADAKLSNPGALTEKAPEVYKAKFETSKGAFVIEVRRASAPLGADRFYNLVKNGYYDNCRFFRVIAGFMVQFGINGDPNLNTAWRQARIQDDPVKESNTRGTVSFATSGKNSRTAQVFINFANNANLDSMGFSPFGKVVEGMSIVDSLYSGYGEGGQGRSGPDQFKIQTEGNAYLTKGFSKLDFIKSATIAK